MSVNTVAELHTEAQRKQPAGFIKPGLDLMDLMIRNVAEAALPWGRQRHCRFL